MTEFDRPDPSKPISLRERLLGLIYDSYEQDDNDTFRYASELFDELYRGDDYISTQENEQAPEYANADIRIIKKIGKKSLREMPEPSRYPLGERLTPKKGGIIYSDRLKIGFRLDKDTSHKDKLNAHVHLFGKNCKDLHIVATVVDNDDYNPNTGGSDEHIVFLEPHGGSEADRNRADMVIHNMGAEKIQLAKVVAINFAGRLAPENRRKPSKDSYQLIS